MREIQAGWEWLCNGCSHLVWWVCCVDRFLELLPLSVIIFHWGSNSPTFTFIGFILINHIPLHRNLYLHHQTLKIFLKHQNIFQFQTNNLSDIDLWVAWPRRLYREQMLWAFLRHKLQYFRVSVRSSTVYTASAVHKSINTTRLHYGYTTYTDIYPDTFNISNPML